MKDKMPCGAWLLLFFLPSAVAAFASLLVAASRSLVWYDRWLGPWWFFSAWCYVFVMSLIHAIVNKRRGGDLVIITLLTTLGMMLVNMVFTIVIIFAGCACAARRVS